MSAVMTMTVTVKHLKINHKKTYRYLMSPYLAVSDTAQPLCPKSNSSQTPLVLLFNSNLKGRMMVSNSNKWTAARGQEIFTTFPSLPFPHPATTRRRVGTFKLYKICKANMSVYNSKKANLSASRKERIKLPIYNHCYRISEFLRHPLGIEAMLNTGSLKSCQSLDANTYRCILPKLQLLSFEAAPVLDLRVTPTDKDCTVEMLSCKFQGSEIVERQSDHFSAFMMNHMTWNTTESEPFLEVDVKLNLTLEVYTQPFTSLPVSAVEVPGNLMMRALVDRLVPLLLEQLMRHYEKWANQQCENIP